SKPKNEGPAAYVLPGDDPRPGNQAELLRTLQAQGVEISRATAPFTVAVRADKAGKKSEPPTPASSPTPAPVASASPAVAPGDTRTDAPRASASPTSAPSAQANPSRLANRTFPAGSYIVRMDQPYSRIADAL